MAAPAVPTSKPPADKGAHIVLSFPVQNVKEQTVRIELRDEVEPGAGSCVVSVAFDTFSPSKRWEKVFTLSEPVVVRGVNKNVNAKNFTLTLLKAAHAPPPAAESPKGGPAKAPEVAANGGGAGANGAAKGQSPTAPRAAEAPSDAAAKASAKAKAKAAKAEADAAKAAAAEAAKAEAEAAAKVEAEAKAKAKAEAKAKAKAEAEAKAKAKAEAEIDAELDALDDDEEGATKAAGKKNNKKKNGKKKGRSSTQESNQSEPAESEELLDARAQLEKALADLQACQEREKPAAKEVSVAETQERKAMEQKALLEKKLAEAKKVFDDARARAEEHRAELARINLERRDLETQVNERRAHIAEVERHVAEERRRAEARQDEEERSAREEAERKAQEEKRQLQEERRKRVEEEARSEKEEKRRKEAERKENARRREEERRAKEAEEERRKAERLAKKAGRSSSPAPAAAAAAAAEALKNAMPQAQVGKATEMGIPVVVSEEMKQQLTEAQRLFPKNRARALRLFEDAAKNPGGAAAWLSLSRCYEDAKDQASSAEYLLRALAHPNANFEEGDQIAMKAMAMLQAHPHKLKDCAHLLEQLAPKYSILSLGSALLASQGVSGGSGAAARANGGGRADDDDGLHAGNGFGSSASAGQRRDGPLIEEIEETMHEPVRAPKPKAARQPDQAELLRAAGWTLNTDGDAPSWVLELPVPAIESLAEVNLDINGSAIRLTPVDGGLAIAEAPVPQDADDATTAAKWSKKRRVLTIRMEKR
eukprot:TRINITY_DN12226_c0_g2_i1.p1 TRINITY_DN12226_c0_g2~~TRINITY_DN12226_c0_g2_i1.p1  ORF type:complete len:782 (-),score=257.91 TRINITY_DN12226_c0_g2_i1:39-2339(-)